MGTVALDINTVNNSRMNSTQVPAINSGSTAIPSRSIQARTASIKMVSPSFSLDMDDRYRFCLGDNHHTTTPVILPAEVPKELMPKRLQAKMLMSQ